MARSLQVPPYSCRLPERDASGFVAACRTDRSRGAHLPRLSGVRGRVVPAGRFFAGSLKVKRPNSTQPFIPGSQGRLSTRWQRPFTSCGHPQPPLITRTPDPSRSSS